MRKKKRRLSRLVCALTAVGLVLTGVALLVACATAGRPHNIAYEWRGFSMVLQPGACEVMYAYQDLELSIFVSTAAISLGWSKHLGSSVPQERRFGFAGFSYGGGILVGDQPAPTVGGYFRADKWAFVALCAVGAVVSLLPLLRSRRRAGHCPCGYDLTGNTSGICPECGQTVEFSEAPATARR